MSRYEGEDGDALVDDLLQDFNNLSRRTVSLSKNLRTLLGNQRRIGCEMKQITNSLKVARYRTEDLATLFERSAKRDVCKEKRKEKRNGELEVLRESCRKEDIDSLGEQQHTTSCEDTKAEDTSTAPYRTRTLSMGGNCSSKESNRPRKHLKLKDEDEILPEKYLSGSISSSTISIPNAMPHNTPPAPPKPKPSTPQSSSKEAEDFPKEVLVVSDGTNSKIYRLCEVDESNILSSNKEKLSSSCKVLQIHVDDPGSPLLRRPGDGPGKHVNNKIAQTFDERGNVLELDKINENGHSKLTKSLDNDISLPEAKDVLPSLDDDAKLKTDKARPLSLDLGPLSEDVGEKFLFLLEEEEEAYERLKEELKEELKIPELQNGRLKETS